MTAAKVTAAGKAAEVTTAAESASAAARARPHHLTKAYESSAC